MFSPLSILPITVAVKAVPQAFSLQFGQPVLPALRTEVQEASYCGFHGLEADVTVAHNNDAPQ